jgi:hypothetical protein
VHREYNAAPRRQRIAADHAAVGDDTDAANGKASAQPLDHRQQSGDVGCVAGPHLRAHRLPLTIQYHCKDHLPQIRTMILAVAVAAEGLPMFPV